MHFQVTSVNVMKKYAVQKRYKNCTDSVCVGMTI